MRESAKVQARFASLLWLLPVLLLCLYVLTDPFAQTLSARKISLSALSANQKLNIQLAATALNGTVLKPGEEFSFNRAVGPRTASRGYEPAPSYLGRDNRLTAGGGICLLSSALYQVALEANLAITERTAHLRPVRTVPAGLDATVSWGQADLCFRNSLDRPVQISAQATPEALNVSLLGRKASAEELTRLRRLATRVTADQLQVAVYRRTKDREMLVSRDLYRLAARPRE